MLTNIVQTLNVLSSDFYNLLFVVLRFTIRCMRFLFIFIVAILSGCAPRGIIIPDGFTHKNIQAGDFELYSFMRIQNNIDPIYIYIEGDGNSFDIHGYPTGNPTPRSHMVSEWVLQSSYPNVAYLARPCQYIMSEQCSQSDWTTGRFSERVVKSTANAIQQIAGNRPIVLIGYSGGAMLSGLVITHYSEITVQKWITVAGVLNHGDWTSYFGDSPLTDSLDMDKLPNVPQVHFIASEDDIVPKHLSEKWTCGKQTITIPDTTHGNIPNINFDIR